MAVDWDWNAAPAWIGVSTAAVSLLINALTYRRSVAERSRERIERERAQATRVSTWVTNSREARIRNGNDSAVVIQPFFLLDGMEAAGDQVAYPPGQTRTLRLPREYERVAEAAGLLAVLPSLLIVDSAGRCWQRTARGDLEPVTAADRAARERRLSGVPIRLELARD